MAQQETVRLHLKALVGQLRKKSCSPVRNSNQYNKRKVLNIAFILLVSLVRKLRKKFQNFSSTNGVPVTVIGMEATTQEEEVKTAVREATGMRREDFAVSNMRKGRADTRSVTVILR